ncbi:MAG: hypothetical protein EU548_03770 [Promethearchaeota archaeon]|nr:MAG: hypothetical protein EU548_03770 [Candidatus Lokiarchaeota archaeon]
MINWIIGVIIIIWLIFKRCSKDGKVEGQPLGMPRGTVRALTTLLIVLFPFWYLLANIQIPGLIVNVIFVLIAFYFEARKSGKERLNKIIKEIKTPENIEIPKKKEKYPLYIPKYSVRISLISILIILILFNIFLGSPLQFEATNTFIDILLIIGIYIIGTIIRSVQNRIENKKIRHQIKEMKDYKSLPNIEIIENFMNQEESWWNQKGRSFFSIFIFLCITFSLILYNSGLDIFIPLFELNLSLKSILLLSIYLCYGFRE